MVVGFVAVNLKNGCESEKRLLQQLKGTLDNC